MLIFIFTSHPPRTIAVVVVVTDSEHSLDGHSVFSLLFKILVDLIIEWNVRVECYFHSIEFRIESN